MEAADFAEPTVLGASSAGKFPFGFEGRMRFAVSVSSGYLRGFEGVFKPKRCCGVRRNSGLEA